VDRPADALCCDKTQDRHLAGLWIDLDIAELGREAGRHAAAMIGPPVNVFLAANSQNENGAKWPPSRIQSASCIQHGSVDTL
jgi:hypothetical protein